MSGTRSLLAVALAALVAAPLSSPRAAPGQASTQIRLATLAPENSPWHSALTDMGAAWQRSTGGRVTLRVLTAGFASEPSMIADLELGTLQAATMMIAGLSEVDDVFNAFGMPFFFQSDEEFAHVREALGPLIEQRLQQKGFHLLNWGNGGWVRIFSKQPIRSVQELKQAKLYTSEGDDRSVRWYASNGFNAVPLATGQIVTQLKLPAGQINAAPSPPYYALALGFYKDAPYMLDVPLGPVPAATIITTRAWNRISAEDRARMQEAALAMQKEVESRAPELDASSIRSMTDSTKAASRPFQVVTLDGAALAAFRMQGEQLAASQRGSLVPADVYDRALQARDEFRRTQTRQ